MLGKRLSFMFIPGSHRQMRQFSISSGIIALGIFSVIFLIIINLILASSFFKSKYAANELDRLKQENKMLAHKYTELRQEIAQVNAIYGDLVKKEIVIRDIFSLPEISTDERRLGIGGPERKFLSNLSEPVKTALLAESELDALTRLARFEKEKYEEVYGTLAEKKSILDHTPSILPTAGYRTRGFGMKTDPFTGYRQFHGGIDIANKTGTPIFATADGVVRSVGNSGGLGKLITIDHGYGYKTRYGHLSAIKVQRGQKIQRGDLIGLMGSTGYSTGPHLHYEVLKEGKQVNPLEYILNDFSNSPDFP
jgi:murein DD-endopeptidase MepM/ murein hydrolase activator NlpD